MRMYEGLREAREGNRKGERKSIVKGKLKFFFWYQVYIFKDFHLYTNFNNFLQVQILKPLSGREFSSSKFRKQFSL